MIVQASRGHCPHLDSVRFLAFMGIFLFHCDPRLIYGALGVSLFFVLSGFLITRLLLQHESGRPARDLGVFYARRALRIFPLYYLVLGVVFLAGRLGSPLWHLCYLHNVEMFLYLPDPGRLGHFWSLCVEEQFYLLFPLALLLTPARCRVHLLLGLLAVSMLARVLFCQLCPDARFWMLLPVAGEYLVWGCLAGLFEVAAPTRSVPAAPVLAAGLLLHALTAVDQFATHLVHPPGSSGLYQTAHGIAFALIVLGLWRLPGGWLTRLLALAPLVYLGRISYGLYVFHSFCLGVDGWFVERLPWLAAVPGPLLVFALTAALAAVSWHCFEAPINRLKDHFAYHRAAAAPA